jgi:hypothetical protein
MIGPDAVGAVFGAASAVDSLSKATGYGGALWQLFNIFNNLKTLYTASSSLHANGLRKARQADANYFFTSAPDCTQLLLRDGGLDPVYEFDVLDPLGRVGALPIPLPVIMIIRSGVTGDFSLDTPVFLPSPKFRN